MKEWYLIGNTTKPNMIGGYENEGFLACKDDAFYETLETDLADTVVLYNYDLSESKEIRCIIQGNTADTYLNLMGRTILTPIGTLKAGNYIFFENEYWLVNGRPGNNKIYEKSTIVECQYKLRWQNANGEIIERFCNATSSSKYDVGETGNSTIILTSDNLTLLLPNDDESLDLDGKRVFIDKRKEKPTKVYKITRTDSVLYDYGDDHGGILSFIADKTELNTNTDNQELRLCDYIDISTPSTPTPPQPENPDETTDLSVTIIGNTNLKIGFSRTYTVNFTNESGSDVDWTDVDFSWNIVSDFDSNAIEKTLNGNTIKLFVDDDSYIDEKFKLQILINELVKNEIIINISEAF